MAHCMVYITVWAVTVTVWAGMISYPEWPVMSKVRETAREGAEDRQSVSQRDGELQKNSISLYLWPDKLNKAAGSLQARERLFICSFVQPKQFGLTWHTDSWAALMKSMLFSFHYSCLTDACSWDVLELWCNRQDLVFPLNDCSAPVQDPQAREQYSDSLNYCYSHNTKTN